jgi:hypothetical protein
VRELDPPVDVGGTVPAGRFLLLAPPASQRERRGVWNLEGQPRHADAVAVTRGQRSGQSTLLPPLRSGFCCFSCRRRSRHPPFNELARAACSMSRGTLSQLFIFFFFFSTTPMLKSFRLENKEASPRPTENHIYKKW